MVFMTAFKGRGVVAIGEWRPPRQALDTVGAMHVTMQGETRLHQDLYFAIAVAVINRKSDVLLGFAEDIVQALLQPLNSALHQRYTYRRVAANQRCCSGLGSAVGKPRKT